MAAGSQAGYKWGGFWWPLGLGGVHAECLWGLAPLVMVSSVTPSCTGVVSLVRVREGSDARHVRVYFQLCKGSSFARSRLVPSVWLCLYSAVEMVHSSKAPQEWEAEAVLGLSLKELVAAVAVGRNEE